MPLEVRARCCCQRELDGGVLVCGYHGLCGGDSRSAVLGLWLGPRMLGDRDCTALLEFDSDRVSVGVRDRYRLLTVPIEQAGRSE
jgi:hypothetical protein